MKRHLTKSEEFDIMKMVLDKFLWLGVIIMAYGFFKLTTLGNDLWQGLLIMSVGIVPLVLFMIILMKEYEFMKN